MVLDEDIQSVWMEQKKENDVRLYGVPQSPAARSQWGYFGKFRLYTVEERLAKAPPGEKRYNFSFSIRIGEDTADTSPQARATRICRKLKEYMEREKYYKHGFPDTAAEILDRLPEQSAHATHATLGHTNHTLFDVWEEECHRHTMKVSHVVFHGYQTEAQEITLRSQLEEEVITRLPLSLSSRNACTPYEILRVMRGLLKEEKEEVEHIKCITFKYDPAYLHQGGESATYSSNTRRVYGVLRYYNAEKSEKVMLCRIEMTPFIFELENINWLLETKVNAIAASRQGNSISKSTGG